MTRAALLASVTGVYFLAGKLGLSFAFLNASASAVWPPTGIALAALLLFGRGLWPAIFVGAFLVNFTTTGGIGTSLAIAAGNTFEALAGAWLVQRYARGPAFIVRAADIFRFGGLVLAATTISPTVGVAALALAGLAPVGDAGAVWATWWLGDAAGALVVTPFVILWHPAHGAAIPPGRRIEAALMLLSILVIEIAVFATQRGIPLAFFCVPPLAWAAFRFGPREAATAIAGVTVIATWATIAQLGPFVLPSQNASLVVLQLFTGTAVLTILPMAALVAEHRAATAEARAANRAKDEFLAMLSHELRNPLQAISNAIALLREPVISAGAKDNAIEIIGRQSTQLTRLVNDLLDLTRSIAGKGELVRRPVELRDAANRAVTIARGSERGAERTIELSGAPVWTHADPGRVDQVLSNVLNNALKYTLPGGRIVVSVERDADEAVIRVSDDGIGMSREFVPRAFDLFTQDSPGLDRSQGGLGIGLALVRRLVEQHGGSVEAHSDGPGRGSTIVLRLAAQAAPEAERATV